MKHKIEQLNQEFGRYYKIDGKMYPSVTYILQVLSKGKHFEKWLGNQASFDSAELEKQKAATRGLLVHNIVESELRGEKIKIEDSVKGYYRGFEKFKKEHTLEIKPKDIEFVVWSERDEYAGTLDLLGTLDGIKNTLIDIKTSPYIYYSTVMQVAGYGNALEESRNTIPSRIWILRLDRAGTYQLKEIFEREKHYTRFLAAKVLWEGDREWRKQWE